ncbi:DUF498-domain-containing protein [Crucibulum laeve]|uniref:NADH dehydrogenase [ubiquinone] 1 alpha subcomplex assembly factor 3 n=1 Tax=Crucibulum laeve TaxID=68775 RepID=A0A5C3MFA7_9AGAR|nr:DUF498-domain-containing protein [Crucibulum laeve]
MSSTRLLPRLLPRPLSFLPRATLLSHHKLPFRSSRRLIHTSRPAYDRSFANILADAAPPPVQVESISTEGIRLADGLNIRGPCLFLEGCVFLWDVPNLLDGKGSRGRWQDWSTERFEVLESVVPRPEILLLGTGKTLAQPPPAFRTYLNKLGIQLEVMDSRNACSTYNILAEEGRRVAAALLPFTPYTWEKSVNPQSSLL